MDERTVERVSRWLQRRFGDHRVITTAELVECAEQDGLPEDVRNVLQGLPPSSWTVDELQPLVQDVLMVQMSAPAHD